MTEKVETARVNIVMKKEVQEYYKSEANSYNLPYTNYIAMILTRIYESHNSINKINHES